MGAASSGRWCSTWDAARARTRSPAAAGLEVLGIDASPRAIGKAMDKARERDLAFAGFLVADVFGVGGLGRRFASVLDCGLFHVLDDHERPGVRGGPARGLGARGRAASAVLQ